MIYRLGVSTRAMQINFLLYKTEAPKSVWLCNEHIVNSKLLNGLKLLESSYDKRILFLSRTCEQVSMMALFIKYHGTSVHSIRLAILLFWVILKTNFHKLYLWKCPWSHGRVKRFPYGYWRAVFKVTSWHVSHLMWWHPGSHDRYFFGILWQWHNGHCVGWYISSYSKKFSVWLLKENLFYPQTSTLLNNYVNCSSRRLCLRIPWSIPRQWEAQWCSIHTSHYWHQ